MTREEKPEFTILSAKTLQKLAGAKWVSLGNARMGPQKEEGREVILPFMEVTVYSPDFLASLISDGDQPLEELRVSRLTVPRTATWNAEQANNRTWTVCHPYPTSNSTFLTVLWLRAVVGQADPLYWE